MRFCAARRLAGDVPLVPEGPGIGKKRLGSIGDCPCLAVMIMVVVWSRTYGFESLHHLTDRGIDERDFSSAIWASDPRGVGVAALDSVFDQLFTDADGLEVHAE